MKYKLVGCGKKYFFGISNSGFICGNYQENNISIDFRLLLFLVAKQ